MKSNQTILLAVVAALGVLAAVLWSTKPAPQPTPETPTKTAPKPVSKTALPPLRTPPAAPEAPEDPGKNLPINPTETGEMPPLREPRAFYGLVDNPSQVQKLLDESVKATGGEVLEKTLLAANWRVLLSMPLRAMSLEIRTDADGSLFIREPLDELEWFLVRDVCHFRQGRIVVECEGDQSEFVHALYMGILGAVPYRLKGLTIPMEGVKDTKDIVQLDLPAPAEHGQMRAFVSRDSGMVSSLHWGLINVNLERERADNAWATPRSWWIVRLAPPSDDKGAAKREPTAPGWQAAARVIDVKPSKDKTLIKLPELTGTEPLSLGTRPAMTVIEVSHTTRAKPEDAKRVVDNMKPGENNLILTPYEAFAPADHVPNLSAGMAFWLALPPHALTVLGEKFETKEIPAEPVIARKIVRSNLNDVPDQLVKFIGEVHTAGHHTGPGPTMVRYISGNFTGRADEMLVELQVPLLGK